MKEEEKEAYDMCLDINKIIFGPLIQSKNPAVIGPNITYMLE